MWKQLKWVTLRKEIRETYIIFLFRNVLGFWLISGFIHKKGNVRNRPENKYETRVELSRMKYIYVETQIMQYRIELYINILNPKINRRAIFLKYELNNNNIQVKMCFERLSVIV